jgi:hypothetical protein
VAAERQGAPGRPSVGWRSHGRRPSPRADSNAVPLGADRTARDIVVGVLETCRTLSQVSLGGSGRECGWASSRGLTCCRLPQDPPCLYGHAASPDHGDSRTPPPRPGGPAYKGWMARMVSIAPNSPRPREMCRGCASGPPVRGAILLCIRTSLVHQPGIQTDFAHQNATRTQSFAMGAAPAIPTVLRQPGVLYGYERQIHGFREPRLALVHRVSGWSGWEQRRPSPLTICACSGEPAQRRRPGPMAQRTQLGRR